MAAPTPVSAYLHSATMVKAGVFLLARLWPVLSGTEHVVLDRRRRRRSSRLLLGAYAAMFQNDLKGLLAYSTISHLGLITLLLGLNSPLAAVAAVFHIDEPRDLQGLAVHVGRHHRPRDRLARHAPARRPLPLHADHRHAGDRRLRRDGRRAAAQRLPVEGNVLRRDGVPDREPVGRVRACRSRRPSPASSRSSIRCASATTCSSVRRRGTCRASRTSRCAGCASRSSCWCWPASSSARSPAWSIGPVLATAARPVVGGTLPDYSLAVWHGFNSPLLMSLVAMAGGIAALHRIRQPLQAARVEAGPAAAPASTASGSSSARSLLATAAGAARAAARRAPAGCSRSCSGCWSSPAPRRSARR